MRLTLRTLLAYLDDVLEPTEAREISQKISQSKEAAALMNQIRESIRRRRIGVPELAGPGSGPDPNVVSEYLENVLPPNQVVEYEQLCRSSDIHLAEVAACHKILTMVMGHPITVEDSLRERMYELGATKTAPTTTAGASASPVPQMTSGISSTDDVTGLEEGLPEYLTRNQNKGKIWSTLLVVIIAGVWIGLVVSDESIWTRNADSTIAGNDFPEVGGQGILPSAIESDEGVPPLATPETPPRQQVNQSTGKKATENAGEQTTVSINPPPPADADIAAKAVVPPAMVKPGDHAAKPLDPSNNDHPTIAELPEEVAVVDPEKMSPPEAAAQPNKTPVLPLRIAPPDELNMVLPAGSERWETASSGDLGIGDKLGVPEPFSGQLILEGDLVIHLLSGTKVQRLASTEGVDLKLKVERGRLLIERPATSIRPRTISILIGKNTIRTTFDQPQTELAIEAELPQPEGRVFDDEPAPPLEGLAITDGKLNLIPSTGEPVELNRATGWVSVAPETGELLLSSATEIPRWTNPEEVFLTPARQLLIKAYEREFQSDVLQSIIPVISDRRAIIAEFAVKTIALIDHYLEIVPALESDHEEARLAAIVALREWLAEDPQRMETLRDEMERVFRPEIVEQIANLLWGYSREDAQSTETSQLLVQLLANENLAIRELAHFHVTRLSGRNYGYHSQAPIAERNAAIGRWVEFVKRDKSLVKPE